MPGGPERADHADAPAGALPDQIPHCRYLVRLLIAVQLDQIEPGGFNGSGHFLRLRPHKDPDAGQAARVEPAGGLRRDMAGLAG